MKEKNINNKNCTPVMRQYWEAKKSYPDSIMLFRMGDFYETFDEDAKIASKVLGITLTKRSNGAASSVPLAGFPYHAYDQYIHKLLASGYKVALCEQVENPKLAKGIVKREVVELLTPGTAINNNFLNTNENNFLSSVYIEDENLGFAIIDNSTGELICGETVLNELNDIVSRYKIREILVSDTQKKQIKSIVFSNIMITSYEDWKADKLNAYDKLIKQFKTKSLKGFGLENKHLAIIAASSCISYVETNSFGKTNHINSITKIDSKEFMHLDSFTLKNLEIFESLNNNKNATLINVVDKTLTASGSRLLKLNLLKPLRNIKKINYRLDCVSEFINHNVVLDSIRSLLENVSDIQRIVVKISNDKANPQDIFHLSNSLSIINKIKKILIPAMGKNIKKINETNNLSKIIKIISQTIKENPAVNLLKGGYVKEGVNKELDELRNIASKANDWLVKYQQNERIRNKIPSLKINYNKVFGYFIDVTKTHIDKVPDNYIRKQTLVNNERYFTNELKEYEEKILSAKDKIIDIERSIFNVLLKDILIESKRIQKNAKILAEIDVTCSNAFIAIENNYIKPSISNDKKFILENSRHPVVEKLLPFGEEFISNNLELNYNKKQIAIITGPNMAGKSTYLRQIALITLLAQSGSYVPAQKCVFGLVDKLFTRVGASDNLAGGESTFLVEMNETANILNNATNKSLVILDEIGRGTSTFDGISLAWAITEYLHNNTNCKPRTLFATHYHELISLANDLSSCFNLNIEVQEYKDEVIFLRKIKEGGASKSYGIHVAKLAGIPNQVIKRAGNILNDFYNNEMSLSTNNKKQLPLFSSKDYEKDDENNKLLQELKEINLDRLTPLESLNVLHSLKKKYDN